MLPVGQLSTAPLSVIPLGPLSRPKVRFPPSASVALSVRLKVAPRGSVASAWAASTGARLAATTVTEKLLSSLWPKASVTRTVKV